MRTDYVIAAAVGVAGALLINSLLPLLIAGGYIVWQEVKV
jgi:hypothetical protein